MVRVTDITLGRRPVAARRQWMTALTPGCDPDMSSTGAPFGAEAQRGPRLGSGLVLLVLVALAAVLATGESVPGAVAVPALVVGVLCALPLVARGIRLAQRAGSAVGASAARAA
jgi:hypothetical protein